MKNYNLLFILFLSACTNQTQTTHYYPGAGSTNAEMEKLISISPPVYPAENLDFGVEGFVLVEFSININGKVENATVVKSYPDSRFSDAAIASVKSAIYKPRTLDKKPIRVEKKLTKVVFSINGKSAINVPIEQRNCENSRPDSVEIKNCKKIQ